MDRSTATLPGPPLPFPGGDRRRRLRHKLHTPVYVSFNGPQTGLVFDLSELLDLNEDGFCVQAAGASLGPQSAEAEATVRLDVNHPVSLCLDLPETKKFVHGSGLVVWRDDTGRVGIRFSPLPETTMSVLKEWLFVNQLIACSNHQARTGQLAHLQSEESSAIDETPAPSFLPSTPAADALNRANRLSDVDDLRRAIREINARDIENGLDSTELIYQFVTEQAMLLTGASGAALALLTGERMLCRKRAGDPAPPLGSEIDVREGLSGECIRTARQVLCADSENDPRVDAELCRALGIRSLLATPVISDGRVVGLLEVLSPHAARFSAAESSTLAQLAELVPWHNEATESGIDDGPARPGPDASEAIAPQPIDLHDAEYAVIEPSATLPVAPPAEETEAAEHETTTHDLQSPASDPWRAASNETTQLDNLRTALWERGPQLEQQSIAASKEEVVEAEAPEPSGSRTPWGNLGLILAAVAAAALALGYLLAPIIERHLNNTAHSLPNMPGHLPVSFQGSDPNKVQAATPDDLHKLADEGDAEAQFMLGTIYRNGDGVLQDDTQAVEWFQRAADQGYVRALSALGSSYWAGRGVKQDYSQAYFWYELALAKGDQNSKPLLEGISTQLTREQVSSARQRAETWLQAHSRSGKIASN
jgi:hypothetical protein